MSPIIQPLTLALVQLHPVKGSRCHGYLWVLCHGGNATDDIDEGLSRVKSGSASSGAMWFNAGHSVFGIFSLGRLAG